LIISVFAISLFGIIAPEVCAQSIAQSNSQVGLVVMSERAKTVPESPAIEKKSATTEEKLNALEQMLERQGERLNQLQQTIAEQQETIRLLASKLRLGESSTTATLTTSPADATLQPAPPQSPAIEDRLKKVETRVSEIGAIKFSGDLRLRSESGFGLSNNLTNGDNPALLGNDLSPRHRLRIRARLQLRGSINDEFDWGLRLASGSFADNISTNQSFTDFFNRKPFMLDQAFVIYKPHRAPGVKIQGGKFEPPWTFTEMTIDNDLMVEGFNESYSRTFKKSTLKDIPLVTLNATLPLCETPMAQ
jgi:uncharacterized coiled-coil protein SlyX